MTADVAFASPTAPRHRARRLLMAGLAVAALVGLAAVLPQAAYYVLPPGISGEADRLAALLDLKAGMVVAEIGAGSGTLTVELARHVGPAGRVYSTELSQSRLSEIRNRVKKAGLDNVRVIEAGETSTNLPDACCAAIVMRNVYHHVGDTRAFNASLRRSVIEGGLVAIIDFEPASFFHLSSPPEGASPQRRGHGVLRSELAKELGAAGFSVEQEIADWGGRDFLVLFRATR
jgi:SAM-dependent methyltransferase